MYYFEISQYRQCRQRQRLPYDLLNIQYLDDNRHIITCVDSYRIAYNETEFLNSEDLEKELDLIVVIHRNSVFFNKKSQQINLFIFEYLVHLPKESK